MRQCRWMLLALLICSSLLPARIMTAQEDTDPAKDNWCFDATQWIGRCGDATTDESRWMWTCGWYMARFEDGSINRAFIETTLCKSLLPPLPPPPPPMPPQTNAEIFGSIDFDVPIPNLPPPTTPFKGACLDSSQSGVNDLMYSGIPNTFNVLILTGSNGTCTGTPTGGIIPTAIASNRTEAEIICQEIHDSIPNNPYSILLLYLPDYGYPAPNMWVC